MFRKHPHEQDPHPTVDELSAYVRDRLRLVFEFATLGAYEEDTAECDGAHDQDAIEPAGRPCDSGARAKRRSAQPHTQVSAVPCERAADAQAVCSTSSAATVRTAARRRAEALTGRRQRRGQVTAPQQPCIWKP